MLWLSSAGRGRSSKWVWPSWPVYIRAIMRVLLSTEGSSCTQRRTPSSPTIGNRGIAGQGPHTGYKSYGARHAAEYAPWANENIIICPSIESLEGLENVEEIAAVEGIDMIAYGHSDLSAQLGIHLDLEHP